LVSENLLGGFLRHRRAKLDPAAFGFAPERRRTPGLRREEVAQRANISSTWYTWLEQGRGGAASADALDRIARALMLTDVEREHLIVKTKASRRGCNGCSMLLSRAPLSSGLPHGTWSLGTGPRQRC
jgi:transcriptional regulator with XRE-family HTH domain